MAVNYNHEWMINMIRSTLREIEVATEPATQPNII